MEYKINNVNVTPKQLNQYLDTLINKIFAILGVYEDCEKTNDFANYYTYIDRVLIELSGCFFTIGFDTFMTLTSLLTGIRNAEVINHKCVKSLVFHCISIVKKMKVDESGDAE